MQPHRPDAERRPAPRALSAVAVLALVAVIALAAGCGGGEPMEESEAAGMADAGGADAGTAAGAAAPPAVRGPAGPSSGAPPADAPIGPLTSRGAPAAAPAIPPFAQGGGAGAGGFEGRLVWDLPAAWTAVPPASSMRMAQASIPGPGGPAEMVLFYFGAGGGGGVEANVERWVGQVDVEGEPERGVFEAGTPGEDGVRVTWVDAAGTLQPSGMGMGPAEPQPGSRLLGAVVEGPGGPWFFKTTGPDETVAAARADFLAMLRAARVE